MHSKGQGLLASLLMFIPLLAVPFVASFGVPWLSAKAKEDGSPLSQAVEPSRSQPGVGHSKTGMHSPEDLFAPVDRRAAVDLRFAPAVQNPHLRNASLVVSHKEGWVDPFESLSSAQGQNRKLSSSTSEPPVPEDPLSGWTLQNEPPGDSQSDAPVPREFPSAKAHASEPEATANPFAEFEANASSPSKPEESQVAVSENAFDDPRGEARINSNPNAFDPSRPLFKENDRTQAAAPVVQAGTRREDMAPAKVSANSGNNVQESPKPLTWETARLRLEALGIKQFYVQENPNSRLFHFRCAYSPPDNPRVTRLFEAEAAEPLEAVRKVLAQVESWTERQSVRPNPPGDGALLQ
jgi:hypothetical protein